MQATVRAKGHRPSRSGLLTVLLVVAVGLALGALAWNVFEDDDAGGGSQSVAQAPTTDGPNSLTRDEVIDTGLMTVAEPGEPNNLTRDDVIDTGRSERIVRVPHNHSEHLGDGVLGGFTVVEPDRPTAFHQDGMGEGWIATGKSVDARIAQDPVALPGIGLFA